eukprot:jgi/Chrzof1/50/Cz01g01200.t1
MAMGQGAARGAFILFEGVDRCGKSTQSAKLVDALRKRGVPAELWKFPDRVGTVTGESINSYLSNKTDVEDGAIHLMFSANRWEKRHALLQALRSGTTLVVDRYAYSGVAYTAAKQVPGLTIDWCRAPDEGLPAPDVTFYLQLPQSAAGARDGFGEERYEQADFQEKVKHCFDLIKDESFVTLDATLSIEQLYQQIMQEAQDVLKRCQEGVPIRQLWSHIPLQKGQTAHHTA